LKLDFHRLDLSKGHVLMH